MLRFTQASRLLRLHTPLGDDVLLAESLHGEEGIGEGFRLQVTALSTDAGLPLKALLGQRVLLELETTMGARPEDWINDRKKKSFSSLKVKILDNYTCHVFLVTPLQWAAHAEALREIVENGAVDNHNIPQRALQHRTPIQALKEWQEKQPELFKKRVYNQAGLDIFAHPRTRR